MTVGIIGFGRLGKLLVRYFAKDYDIMVFDIRPLPRAVRALGARPGTFRQVCAQDVVIPCVPIKAFEAVIKRWGDKVRTADGSLDRAALRAIVFADPGEREALNGIIHPRVEELRHQAVTKARERGDRIVVCDIPLLYEKDLAGLFDCVVLVDAPRGLRLQRLVRERALPIAEAEAMIDAQMPADTKRTRADYIINNAGTHAQLEARILEVWQALTKAERLKTN